MCHVAAAHVLMQQHVLLAEFAVCSGRNGSRHASDNPCLPPCVHACMRAVNYTPADADWTLFRDVQGCPCCLGNTNGVSICAKARFSCWSCLLLALPAAGASWKPLAGGWAGWQTSPCLPFRSCACRALRALAPTLASVAHRIPASHFQLAPPPCCCRRLTTAACTTQQTCLPTAIATSLAPLATQVGRAAVERGFSMAGRRAGGRCACLHAQPGTALCAPIVQRRHRAVLDSTGMACMLCRLRCCIKLWPDQQRVPGEGRLAACCLPLPLAATPPVPLPADWAAPLRLQVESDLPVPAPACPCLSLLAPACRSHPAALAGRRGCAF